MKTNVVREMMIPLTEYATVDAGDSLQDALLALKSAQNAFQKNPHHHRNVLVVDSRQRVVGKVSQLDLIKGLEDGYQKFGNIQGVNHFGYDQQFIKILMDRGKLWQRPLSDLCRKSAETKVRAIMNEPTDGEFVQAGATVDEAIHQMVMTRHHSLLVTDDGQIVGVLRLVDIFEMVAEEMAACSESKKMVDPA